MFAEIFIALNIIVFFAAPALGGPNPLLAIFTSSDFLWLVFYTTVLGTFGRSIEKNAGGTLFATVYISAGLIGNLVAAGVGGPYPSSLGAGAALLGVIGMLAAIRPLAFVVIDLFPMPAFAAAAFVLIVQFLVNGAATFLPLLTGMLLGYALKGRLEGGGAAPKKMPWQR